MSLLIGGGTTKGLPSTMALEVLALPMVFMIHGRRHDGSRTIDPWALGLIGLVALSFLVQLLPVLHHPAESIAGTDISVAGATLSGDIGRTLDSLAFTAMCVTAFLAISGLSNAERNTVLAMMSIGFVVNFVIALIQFAAANGAELNLVGYPMRAGIFANENHFSSLLYVSIPFWIYQFNLGSRRWLGLIPVAAILFIEFANGSSAGIFIALAATMLSVSLLWDARKLTRALIVAPVGIGLVLALFELPQMLKGSFLGPLAREGITSVTVQAIRGWLPFGSGFGSFPIVYPQFVAPTDIFFEFVNHAHDDFLELVLEGGVLAAAGLLLYAAIMVRAGIGIWRGASKIRSAALLAVGFLLIHSTADYPLRTVAMAMVFVYANAVVLAPSERTRSRAVGDPAARPAMVAR